MTVSGIDGAGKSTQLALLRARLEDRGYRCASQVFAATSYDQEAADEVDRFLAGGVDCLFTRPSIDWTDRYSLVRDFVYDAHLQSEELALAVTAVFAGACVQLDACCIRPLLARGVHIVCDRYWYDEVVYRGYWVVERIVRQLHAPLRPPDLALLLDIPPRTTHTTQSRPWRLPEPSSEGYRGHCRGAESVPAGGPEQEGLIVIDGDRSEAVVSAEVMGHALPLLGPRAT